MKQTLKTLSAGALVLAALEQVHAQYAPPPPPTPFQGFLNEYLRGKDPYMNQWDFGGNLRLRYEDKDGFAIPGTPASSDFRKLGGDHENGYLLTRLRYHVGYTEKWWSGYVEGRDSFATSDQRFAYFINPPPAGTKNRNGHGPESDQIDLHQAFFTLGNHKEFPLSLKVGRQEMSYGEERLIGAFGWNNIGRSFDAAKLRWQNPYFGVDFFASRPVIPEDNKFNVDNDYDYFSGAYATSMMIPHNILDVYVLSRNASRHALSAEQSPQFPQPTARDIYTVGGRFKSKPGDTGDWDYSVEGAYQFGDFAQTATGPRKAQSAYMYVLQGGYTFNDVWATPRLGLEFSYSSGDNNSADGVHHTFDNLFPTNHKFYGYMDFVSLQNIQDIREILQLKPTPRLSVAVEGHSFWLADTHDAFYTVGGTARPAPYAVNATTANFDAFVGSELDVIAGYAITRYAQIEGGYGHFFTGDYINSTMAGVGGSRDANYLYTQLSVNF